MKGIIFMKTAVESEAGFLKAVLQLAALRRWKRAHFRPARTATGWRTPCQADAAGFPDLLLVRGDRLVVAELKSERGITSEEQTAWLDAFRLVGAEVFIWKPRDWSEVERVLA